MVAIKTQLSNVAFGGSWSEEILRVSEISGALKVIGHAATICCETDVRTAKLVEALDLVAGKIEKGPQLKVQFLKAIAIENQQVRSRTARKLFDQMQIWAGQQSSF